MNWIVIVAGGNGERMKTPVNKVFLSIARQPIISWTMRVFENHPLIDAIILVVRKQDMAALDKIIKKGKFKKIRVVLPSEANRQLSSHKAIDWLKKTAAPEDLVGIHNAVNPFVTIKEIMAVYAAAGKHGAALLAQPAKDTIKIINAQQTVKHTPARQSCWHAQTPQVAKYHLLAKAFKHARLSHFTGTDDTQLLERIGVYAKTVPCSNHNIKITYYEDLIFARQLFRNYHLAKNYE
ncbi:2-C-methyl-D-erythritol 4-phosphate cytidylyltransferase [Patescibacteria group bacterium]|nr:2-C-methyl-D-erythritol 4-phosphate cytidylyltransferase [Patescibacteria group bacterium]MCL5091370.1 2-C-methyl-D-erythritol 4-phosphate cytidylyltransferase [Patescibacteria group bacterium]